MVVSSLEMKRKPIQTKAVYKFLSSVSKETTHKPSKVAAEKNLLSSMHVINTKLFWWMLFIPFGNWKSMLFVIVFVPLRLFQPPYCSFLWDKCFGRSPLSPRYSSIGNNQSYRIVYLIKFCNYIMVTILHYFFVTVLHFSL